MCCEIAYELALHGKKVSIVEMKDDLIAQTGVCLANSSYLRELDVFVLFLCCEGSGDIACGGNDGVAGNFNCFARFIGADNRAVFDLFKSCFEVNGDIFPREPLGKL